MITSKGLNILKIAHLSKFHIIWLLLFSSIITVLYHFNILKFNIPWIPVSVIGTAVAFFVGFKNNQAYDRMWEARKIWGGIVNNSRTWGMQVNGYITALFNKEIDNKELKSIKKRLIYRHIAWLYSHRNQLLKHANWEHGNPDDHIDQTATNYQNKLVVGLTAEEAAKIKLKNFISKSELEGIKKVKNKCTQIINKQSRDLSELRGLNVLDDLRHYGLMKTLGQFYELQGKNERIKTFPLPRQYANISRYFTGVFLLLLPFTLIPELIKTGELGIWLAIPLTTLIGWVYIMMELVGEYTENPFEGLPNDIPMLSMCRNIEIDLKEMLMETDVPDSFEPKKNIIM